MQIVLNGLDIVLSLKATPLANFFAILTLVSTVAIFIAKDKRLSFGFNALFVALFASLNLIIYANDFLLLFVGWEAMSITTYFLLSYSLPKEILKRYIIFATASALSMLIAIAMIYSSAHSFLYTDAKVGYESFSYNSKILFNLLIFLAIFIKLGVIGVHYWLIDTYEKSFNFFTAMLSAVISKMGIYALIVVTLYTKNYSEILGFVGVFTSIIATFKAVNEDSIKRVLAYSSISQIGYIITVLSVDTGIDAAIYHSLIHTTVKVLLFINVAGIIYTTNRSYFSQLGGLVYRMPQSFVLLLIGAIALAGMPPLGGFNSKFLIYTTLLENGNLLLLLAVLFSSISAFLYIYKLIYGIYLGHPTNHKLETVKEAPVKFLIPQYLSALVLIVLGAYPAMLVPYLNDILQSFKLDTIKYENSSLLISKYGSYDGFVTISMFTLIFVAILLIIIKIRSRVKNVKDRFDIAYCAEKPSRATKLHYGYSIAKELNRVWFIRAIFITSVKRFYDKLSICLFEFSKVAKRLNSGNMIINIYFAVIFFIILLWSAK